MRCTCYLRRGNIYIPTMGIVDEGFYRGVEPVAVVPVSNTEALRRAFNDAIARGNPKVPSLNRFEYPSPVILKYAGVKSWPTFARNASTWAISEKDGVYKILGYRRASSSGWTEDKDNVETFPIGSTMDDVVTRIIAILQTA